MGEISITCNIHHEGFWLLLGCVKQHAKSEMPKLSMNNRTHKQHRWTYVTATLEYTDQLSVGTLQSPGGSSVCYGCGRPGFDPRPRHTMTLKLGGLHFSAWRLAFHNTPTLQLCWWHFREKTGFTDGWHTDDGGMTVALLCSKTNGAYVENYGLQAFV